MALKVELKPFERIIIGQSIITNSDARTRLLIEGEAPILREKDILTGETANTPVKRLYLCVQMMYLEDDIPKYQDLYMGFVKDLLEASKLITGIGEAQIISKRSKLARIITNRRRRKMGGINQGRRSGDKGK